MAVAMMVVTSGRSHDGNAMSLVLVASPAALSAWVPGWVSHSAAVPSPWQVVILDEAHKIKDPGSQRTKAKRELRV